MISHIHTPTQMYDTHYDCAANNINYHIELKTRQDWEAQTLTCVHTDSGSQNTYLRFQKE